MKPTLLLRSLLPLLACLFAATTAEAHKTSDSFLYLDTTRSELRADIPLRDLARVVPLDTNADQIITGAEFRAGQVRISQYVESGVSIASPSGGCTLTERTQGVAQHSDGAYTGINYAIACPNGEQPQTLEYSLLFEQDPLHRGLLSVRTEGTETLDVFTPDRQTVTLAADGEASALTLFGTFVYEGVIHLLIGLDHILFLLVLMLPATMKGSGRDGQRTLKQRIWQLTGIVTAFTVAHSITLGLAALDVVRLPITWVETVIALSIALAALNVAWPILGRKTWKLAFGFGLIHGFGFASVLGDLTSGLEQTALALAGFNIGVELGQIALLLVVFPILYMWGQADHYRRLAVPVVLLATGALSLFWVAERAMAI